MAGRHVSKDLRVEERNYINIWRNGIPGSSSTHAEPRRRWFPKIQKVSTRPAKDREGPEKQSGPRREGGRRCTTPQALGFVSVLLEAGHRQKLTPEKSKCL